jgi:hypothetical protein
MMEAMRRRRIWSTSYLVLRRNRLESPRIPPTGQFVKYLAIVSFDRRAMTEGSIYVPSVVRRKQEEFQILGRVGEYSKGTSLVRVLRLRLWDGEGIAGDGRPASKTRR